MEEIEYIDAWFSGQMPADEIIRFDQRIREDPAFAKAVALYLSSHQLLREEALAEKKQAFRRLYESQNPPVHLSDHPSGHPSPDPPSSHSSDHPTGHPPSHPNPSRPPSAFRTKRIWITSAIAALVAGLVIALFLIYRPASPSQLADQYVKDNFQALGITMSSHDDSLQQGKRLFNEDHLREALTRFETLLRSDSTNSQTAKDAGIVSLRLQDYDKAIKYFQLLDAHNDYANPAKFYEAITLLKRNHPGDAPAAKQLLEQVVHGRLEYWQDAQEWLKRF